MGRFLTRISALLLIVAAFLTVSFYLIEPSKYFFFLNRHHGIILAYLGTALSIISLVYMLRKYGIIKIKSVSWWFKFHVIVGALGIFLILVHGRYNLNALIPTLDIFLLIVIGITGLFGWHLYFTKVKGLLAEIQNLEEAEEYTLSKMASTAYHFWHFIHILASIAVLCLTLVHILSLIIFRGQY